MTTSLLGNTTLDDSNSVLAFTGPWHAYTDASKGWRDDTLTYCGGSGNATSASEACEMRLSVKADWFMVSGHTNSSQGVFDCRLEYTAANGTEVAAPLPWAWYDGAHTNGGQPNPITLCSAYGLPLEDYTFVLTVQRDQVFRGIGVDFATYATLNGSTAGGSGWYSQLNSAVPPTALRDTTARPMLPPSTSSALPTASATASASSKPSGGLQVGLSVGLSGLFVVLAVVATWYFFRRRQRSARRSEKSSLHSLSWTPDMHSLRSSTVASASSTSHDAATLNAKAASGRVLRSAERDGAQTPDLIDPSHGPFDDRYAASEASAIGTYGSNATALQPPHVFVTPPTETGTLGSSPFDDVLQASTLPSALVEQRIDIERIDRNAPLEHPDSFRPRYY